jgi:stage V sporulation protein B
VLLPSISELKTKKLHAEIKTYAKDSLKLSLLILIPVTAISISFSESIITLLFGKAYAYAAKSFEILVVGMVFLGIFTIASAIFQGVGKPEIPMKILFITAILDVIFNILLIPRYHIEGAAFATSLSCIFAGVASLILLRKFI